jgi:methionine aminopeptidase
VLTLCTKGDALLTNEMAKVYRRQQITKGFAAPTTVTPNSFVTPFTPLVSDAEDACISLKAGELVKVQLGAHVDGFAVIVCNTIIVPRAKQKEVQISERTSDLLLATYYANELMLRLMVPSTVIQTSSEVENLQAELLAPVTQSRINTLIEKIAKSYDVRVIQQTTSSRFDRNETESGKKIILAPGDGEKGEDPTEVGEVWGVEICMSLGSGEVKNLEKRSTLLKRTKTICALIRPSSREVLSEVTKKFGSFPFSLRQLDDERAGKVGAVECIRTGVLREYKPAAEADGSAVSRLFTTIGKPIANIISVLHSDY